MQQNTDDILISVVIVNYKVPEYLIETIRSLRDAQLYEKTEVIVVDNDSQDQSQQIITGQFPEIIWIQMKNNVGFGKACNIGVKKAQGTYILLLNPDTVISKNTLVASINFMKENPEVGMMGPKILNPDGTLQESCHRSFPSPMDAVYHFLGLGKIFHKNKRFGKYYLTYLDPDISTQVDAISGSFMFISRSLYNQIGGFDEHFFMYGEDLDLCWRVSDAGYKVWYFPDTKIIHRKGKSSDKVKLRSRIAFYEAMVIFSTKYKNRRSGFFPGWFIFFGIFIKASISLGANFFKYVTPAIIDLLLINTILWLGIVSRFGLTSSPYHTEKSLTMITIHCLISICFLSIFAYNGVYIKRRYSIPNIFLSAMMASVLFIAALFFFKSMAFSRIAFAISSLAISIVLVFWREFIPQVVHRCKQILYSPSKIVVVGSGTIAQMVIRNIEEQKSGKICGVLWTEQGKRPGEYEGYPVLGSFSELKSILSKHNIDTLLISTSISWYSLIIDALSSLKIKNLSVQWVPHEYFSLNEEQIPPQISLRDFSI